MPAPRYRPRAYPGLFLISAQAAPGVRLEDLERAIHRETDRLAKTGPTASELDETRRKIRRGAELSYEGASGTGFRLGYFAMLGDDRFESRLLDAVLKVPARAVREYAGKLFRPERRAVVAYEPRPEGSRAG